jgi:hypothetical protein
MSPQTPRDPERPVLEGDDARLVARLRDAWAPEPLTPARRAAFDAGLEERLDRARRGRRLLWPALGASLTAASLTALLLLRQETVVVPPAPVEVASSGAASTAQRAEWAAALLYTSDDEEDERVADDDGLPAEYAAIAGVFLDR